MKGIIVPKKTIGLFKEMAGWCRRASGSGHLRRGAHHLPRRRLHLVSKLIDGTFPDYARVIPANNPNTLDVRPEILAGAVDRVSTVSSERGRAVKLEIDGDTVALSVNSPDAGEARRGYDGHPRRAFELAIGFNAAYLTTVLGHLRSRTPALRLADPAPRRSSPTPPTTPASSS